MRSQLRQALEASPLTAPEDVETEAESAPEQPRPPRRRPVAAAVPGDLRRVSLADIDALVTWLWTRLQARYSRADIVQFRSFLCGCTTAADYWFVRTDAAIFLAAIHLSPLIDPVVVEHFALAVDYPGRDPAKDMDLADYDAEDAVAVLYPVLATWARGVGAKSMKVLSWSDARPEKLERVVSDIDVTKLVVVRL
jgi:hypothetical protein